MNSWSVWAKMPDGTLVLRGFADFGSAVNYANALGGAFVALVAPGCAGLVHVWRPLGEENAKL